MSEKKPERLSETLAGALQFLEEEIANSADGAKTHLETGDQQPLVQNHILLAKNPDCQAD